MTTVVNSTNWQLTYLKTQLNRYFLCNNLLNLLCWPYCTEYIWLLVAHLLKEWGRSQIAGTNYSILCCNFLPIKLAQSIPWHCMTFNAIMTNMAHILAWDGWNRWGTGWNNEKFKNIGRRWFWRNDQDNTQHIIWPGLSQCCNCNQWWTCLSDFEKTANWFYYFRLEHAENDRPRTS